MRTNCHKSRTYGLWLLILSPLLTGCQGCRDEPDDPQAKPPATEIDFKPIRALPDDGAIVGIPVKPGHWMSVGQLWKANSQDYRGQLTTEPLSGGEPSGGLLASRGFRSIRPAVLPKGQTKQLDSRILIPGTQSIDKQRIAIRGRFDALSQGIIAESGADPAIIMAPDEYFFVVLTERPERFASLQIQDWVSPPSDTQFATERQRDYRIVFPSGEGMLPVPDTFFEWTSIAYLLWDDVAVEKLTVDQRRAVRDWLHWGGQIIVNGPAAAQALSESEFGDLLPVGAIRSEGLESDRLISMIRRWSVQSDRSVDTLAALLDSDAERIGVSGSLRPEAVEVPRTDGLISERRRGRGRVAMSHFDLTASWLPKWSSMQSFYNGVLLRRPPRAYGADRGMIELKFAGVAGQSNNDPRIATRLRIFARDATLAASHAALREDGGAKTEETRAAERTGGSETAIAASARNGWWDRNVAYVPASGINVWTDRSEIALMASQLLRDEAGISIPNTSFVAKSLAIYLCVLVPLNYLCFAIVGRLEWAWVAVPVIGLVGAAWVARSAQLDIGFARSQTEVNLLEIQPHYPRAHLSQFLALYNSLSTTYEFRFADRNAVAAPVGLLHEPDLQGQFVFRHAYDEGVTLEGVTIASNQTKAIHAEQMIDLGGAIAFDPVGGTVENGTDLTILDASVVTREADGTIRSDSLGMLEPGKMATIRLRAGRGRVAGGLPMGVERMMSALIAGDDLAAGEYRLVGRCETLESGLTVAPAVSQSQQQTVLVVNLSLPSLPEPETDRNLRVDIQDVEPEGEDFSF